MAFARRKQPGITGSYMQKGAILFSNTCRKEEMVISGKLNLALVDIQDYN
jgi:hypothetical protein